VPLAWRWSFSDGGAADGRVVTHRFASGSSPAATLRVVDGTDSVAEAVWPGTVSPAAHPAGAAPTSHPLLTRTPASHAPASAASAGGPQGIATDRLAASTLGRVADGGGGAAPAVTAGGLTVLVLLAVGATRRRRAPRRPR